MKLAMTKQDLTHNCLDLISKLVATRTGASDIYKTLTIRVSGNKVEFEASSDIGQLRITKTVTAATNGEVNIPFDSFIALIRSLDKTDEVWIMNENAEGATGYLGVAAQRGDTRLFTTKLNIAAGDYTALEIPEVGDTELEYATEDLDKVFHLCDKSDYSFRYRGIFFVSDMVFGGTAAGISLLKGQDISDCQGAVDPRISDIVSQFDKVLVGFGDRKCHLYNGDKTIQLFATYLTIKPPSVSSFVEDLSGPFAELEQTTLENALRHAATLASSDRDSGTFDFKEEKLVIENVCRTRGSGTFYAPANFTKDFKLNLSIPAMLKALSVFSKGQVTLSTPENMRFVLLSQGNLSVVVPQESE